MKKSPAQTYLDTEKEKIYAEALRNKLKLKSFEAKNNLTKKHPKANKFFQLKGLDLSKIRQYSAKVISSGAITGALLLSPPVELKALPSPHELLQKLTEADLWELGGGETGQVSAEDKKKILIDSLSSGLPEKPRPLSRDEEKAFEQVFAKTLGILARGTLEGEHLNQTYGYIGIEQHLRRYPGDYLSLHGEKKDQKEGMAPGLGAWGYLANSKDEMTPELVEIEKWYAVVQTLYLPDWNKRQPYLKNWYKHRKVLIVNTENGNSVVAAIADSGPAAWTGKQFGGSPEVMNALGGEKYKKGKVILFFVDDPENKVALGPVTL